MLVYSLLILSTLLIVVTGFSLYVTRASRTLAVATDTAVATYVAESGVEEGLFLLRREGVNVADLAFPYPRVDGEGNVLDAVDPLASIASTSERALEYDADDLQFFDGVAGFSGTAYAELRSTSTVKEIVMDVPQDDVAYADVYDASGATDLAQGSGIGSVLVEWDQGTGAAWLEASIVELDAQSGGAELRSPRTQVLGPSLHSGYCFNDLSAAGPANLHRLRFRALFADVRNLRVTGYRSTSCPEEASPAVLPGRTTVTATGRYRRAKQTVQISMPQQTLPSGLFGFVVFSDQSLVKLSAGVGNLQFWPQIPNGFVWPDGVSGPANTYRFTYPLEDGIPDQPSSTVGVLPGRFGPGATEQVPTFVLVNTDRSGITFASGDVTITASGNYADKFQIDYGFATQDVGGVQVLAADDQLRTCQDLAGAGSLSLTAYNTPPTNILDGEGNPVGSFYTDRCAVGVQLADPSGVTTAIPLRGRLVAYADPGGTASVALEYDPPMPVLRVERQQADSSWVAVTNGTIYDFGGIAEGGTATTDFRICNVGTEGTTLTVQGGDIVVNNTDPAGSTAFGKQSEGGVPAALERVTGNDCSDGDTVTFEVAFNASEPIAYSGTLDIATNAPDFRISLRGSAQTQSPDWDGNWDCWGIGDTNSNGTNEIRCGWTNFAGVASYDVAVAATCGATGEALPVPLLQTATVSSASCGATCTYTYDVTGDTAGSSGDDRFRCHQIRSVGSSGTPSGWTKVRGTTGAVVGSPNVKRFFLAYSDTAFPDTTFSGDLRSHSAGTTWQEDANALCRAWAQRKLGITANFNAWMCGRNSNVQSCQSLAPSTTYVWLDSGPQSLQGQGVSFRTDTGSVPLADYWRGGSTISCDNTTDCAMQRKHVYSVNGGIADQNAQYFRVSMLPVGSGFQGGGDCPAEPAGTSSWVRSTGNSAKLGMWGSYGSGRWNADITRAGACEQNSSYAIYCAEVPTLSGVPSGLSVTWSPTDILAFSATWNDGVSGESGYQVSTSAPGHWTVANLPAGSQTLPSGTIGGSCALARSFANPWTFRVAATDGSSWTAPSTANANRPSLSAPALPRVQWVNASQIRVRWNDVAYDTGYQVSLQPSSGPTVYATTSAGATSQTFSVTAGTTYTVKVRMYVENGTCDVFGPETTPITFVMPASVKKIADSSPHDGNFEDDDGNSSNGNWYASADALCQSSSGLSNSKALMWYRPGGGANALRPGTVTHSGVTYVNPNNIILFRASSDNNVPGTTLGPTECRAASCTGLDYWTGYGSWNDGSDCTNWSSGGSGVIGKYYDTDEWLRWSPVTLQVCSNANSLYCVEQ